MGPYHQNTTLFRHNFIILSNHNYKKNSYFCFAVCDKVQFKSVKNRSEGPYFLDWDWDRFYRILGLGFGSIFQKFGIGLGITNSGQNPMKSQESQEIPKIVIEILGLNSENFGIGIEFENFWD